MKKLILVADDFGITNKVNKAIVKLWKQGIIGQTALLANGAAFTNALKWIKKYPTMEISCHLTFTYGKPVLNKINCLTDASGNFIRAHAEDKNFKPNINELRAEWEAQIQKLQKAKIKISALNCHHNVQGHTHVQDLFLELAQKYNLPIRNVDWQIPKTKLKNINFIIGNQTWYGPQTTLAHFEQIITSQLEKEKILDIQTHPGFYNQALKKASSYAKFRAHEFALLASPEFKALLKKHQVILSFYQAEFKSK